MNLWQKVYNWLDSLKTPEWLKVILGELQDILVSVLLQTSQVFISQLEQQIIAVNDKYPDNKQKFEAVYKWTMSQGQGLKDSAVNLLIETCVARLKAKGKI